jgi:hypothetical protein
VDYYVNGLSGSGAVRKAGFKGRWVDRLPTQLLKTPKVAAAIEARQREQRAKSDVAIEDAIADLIPLARASIENFIGPDNKMIPVKKLAPGLARCIASVDVLRSGRIIRYHLHNKLKSWELIGKMLGWIKSASLSIQNNTLEITDERRERILAMTRAILAEREEQRALAAPKSHDDSKS